MRLQTTVLSLVGFILGAVVPVTTGQSLAASQERHGFGFGYGDYRWDNFSAELDARFDSVTIIQDLSNLNEMLNYDALMIQLREWGASLTAQEQTNVSDYIATGRRVLFIGENNLWSSWNSSFLTLVGGSYSGREGDGIMTVTNPYSPLTDGVTSIDLPDGGLAVGGLSLFNTNFATVWDGDGSDNAFSMLDVNVFEDDRWNTLDGAQFAANVAEWLATGASGGPGIEVIGSCPGRLNVTVTNATPQGRVALVFALSEGSFIIPNNQPCAGTELGLEAPVRLVHAARADAAGTAVFSGNAPAAACGGFVQAVDISTCQVTSVAGI